MNLNDRASRHPSGLSGICQLTPRAITTTMTAQEMVTADRGGCDQCVTSHGVDLRVCGVRRTAHPTVSIRSGS